MMDKILIYTFWLGNKKKRKDLEKYTQEFNKNSHYFMIVLGPTVQEHDFLLENNKAYAYFFKRRDYSNMSCIYRFWIASKNTNIIYMDERIEFKEEKLYELFLECKNQNKNCFIFKSYRVIWGGFFISINATNIFLKCFTEMSNQEFLDSSLVLTKYLRKDRRIKSYKKNDKYFADFKHVNFLNFNSNDFDTIKFNPSNSISGEAQKKLYKMWSKKIHCFRFTSIRDLIYLNSPFYIQKLFLKFVK